MIPTVAFTAHFLAMLAGANPLGSSSSGGPWTEILAE